MTGVEVNWNGISSSTITGLVFENPKRSILGKPRGNFLTIPGRRGSWYFPEFRDRREITIPGFIEASTFSARRDAVTSLADWLDVDIQARLILGDDPTVYYEAVLTDPGEGMEWRDLAQFELVWEVQPYSLALVTTQIVLAGTNNYSTTFDPGLLTDVYPIIEIKPTNGTITSFDLTVNGDLLHWAGTILSGNTITINSGAAVVLNGVNTDLELLHAYDPAYLIMSAVTGVFPSLIPGTNSLQFMRLGGTATAVTITITYRKAYRK
jgi:putative phage tail component, N-terminal domain